MSKPFFLFLVLVMFLGLCLGCGTGFCIKVGGNYEGKEGSFEYCYDPIKSKELGQTIMTDKTGKESVLLSEIDAAKILQQLPASKEVEPVGKTNLKKLLDRIK